MSNLLKRLMVVYGQPESTDPSAFLDEVATAIQRFDDKTQDRAADLILRTHKRAFFPSPAVIIQACEEVETLRVKPVREDGPKYPDWAPSAIAKADQLIVSDVGRLAADEGWSLALHDFCRKRGRLPNHAEQFRLKKESKEFDDAYTSVLSDDRNVMKAALVKLGDEMLKRRNKYAAMAYGEILE